jgi:hypothetical protein
MPLLLSAAFVAGGVMHGELEAQEFLGIVTVEWHSGGAVARRVQNSHRGFKVRSEDLAGPMKGSWRVMDWATGKGFVVIPAERMASPLDMAAMKAVKDQAPFMGEPENAPGSDLIRNRSQLRIRSRQTGQWQTIWEVTSVERRELPAVLFEIPPGYRMTNE